MSLFKTRSNYFKGLAILNKQIAHTKNGRKSFFRMNDQEELAAACINWAHFPCLVHFGYRGKYTANPDEVNKRVLANNILVLAKSPSSTDMDAIEDTKDLAFEVLEQLISKMMDEAETEGYCAAFQNIDLSSFSFNEYGPVNSNLYGWELSFSDETFPDNITYFDASKWDETEEE